MLATQLRQAARSLLQTTDRIIDVAVEVGFGDVSNFNAQFSRAFGVSPRSFRERQGRGTQRHRLR